MELGFVSLLNADFTDMVSATIVVVAPSVLQCLEIIIVNPANITYQVGQKRLADIDETAGL